MNRACFAGLAAAFLLGGLPGGEAAAHDVWLKSTSHGQADPVVVAGERADVRLLAAHFGDPEPVARNDRLVGEFIAHGPGGAQPVPGVHGMDPAGIFRPDRPGLWSLIYVGLPQKHRLDAASFESYLGEEGLDWVSARRRDAGRSGDPGRELFSRSLEELVPVCVGAPAESEPVPASASGLRSESAPDSTEAALPVRFRLEHDDHAVGLRLVAEGEPVAGALVDLRRDGRLVTSVRTDRDGRLRLRPEDGTWVATAVIMSATDDPRADWRTYFAALTFPWPIDACR